MDTRVVFATSHDGVRVAAGVKGSGFPLLYLNGPLYSHCHIAAFTEDSARFHKRLMTRRAFTMVDIRGCGLADRGAITHSFDDYVADLLALYDAMGIHRADVLALSARPSLAIRFAGSFPERVRRLYLWGSTSGPTAASGYAMLTPGVRELAAANWDVFVNTLASRGSGSEALVPALSARMRMCATQEDVLRWMDCLAATNIEGDAQKVSCPTLIAELDNQTLREAGHAEKLAAQIRNSELVFLPNREGFGWTEEFADAIERFDAQLDAAEGHPTQAELSPRETEVLTLLASGHTNSEIASALNLSRSTVDRHVANIYAKLNLRNRAEATRWALTHGLGLPGR
jgi:DNA-binding CsgD family transcriptional regulator/pimeloyl-ACP methyl ester carboxylesterase